MSRTLPDVHPQMLRASIEGDRKHLAERGEADPKRLLGRSVERALELLGVSKKQAAFAMHYEDAGVISRWCAGTERPLFDKLFAIEGFKRAWLLALVEDGSDGIDVETTIRIRRRA